MLSNIEEKALNDNNLDIISEMEEAADKSEMFKFVRIGEDYDDVDNRGYGFDIHVNRSIDY